MSVGEGVIYPTGEDGKVLGSVLAGKQMIAASYAGVSEELAAAALAGSFLPPALLLGGSLIRVVL
jgi:hypothetical protein